MNPKAGGARIWVEWGNEIHEITLTPRNWRLVKAGHPLRIRGSGAGEGKSQWEYWNFAGSLSGRLFVEYGNDGAVGFEGRLCDAEIEILDKNF
jgi:hypothetical protein